MARTSAYKFTVGSLDDPRIAKEKAYMKKVNLYRRLSDMEKKLECRSFEQDRLPKWTERFVVRVRGRLGKHNIHAHLYRKGGALYRSCAQTIRPEHATRFDVYVHSVSRPFTGK